MSAGKYSEALPLAQAMVASLEKSDNGRELAAALNNLGQVHAGQGRDDLAEPLYKRSIALMERSLGLDTPLVSAELTNLAGLYQRQGRFTEAEPLFKRALAVSEKGLSREHPDVGRALNNLATLYVKQERQTEAAPLFLRALAIYQKASGSNDGVPVQAMIGKSTSYFGNSGSDAQNQLAFRIGIQHKF